MCTATGTRFHCLLGQLKNILPRKKKNNQILWSNDAWVLGTNLRLRGSVCSLQRNTCGSKSYYVRIDFSWCLTIYCDLSMIYLLMHSKQIQNRLKMNSQHMGHFQNPAPLRIVTHHFLQFPHRRRYLCIDISCHICDNIFSSIQIAYPPSYATILISWQLSGSTLPPNMLDLGDMKFCRDTPGNPMLWLDLPGQKLYAKKAPGYVWAN